MRQVIVVILLNMCLSFSAYADVIRVIETRTTNDLSGGFGQNPSEDYLGVVTSESPLQINSDPTSITNFHGLSPQVGDVIGRDLRAGGGFNVSNSIWNYVMNVPTDVTSGTGLYDIGVSGLVSFANANYEGQDDLTFELYLNGVLSSQLTVEGIDGGGTSSVNMGPFSLPADQITSARLQVQVGQFQANDESFLLHDLRLFATYSAIPEPASWVGLTGCAGFLFFRRKRRRAERVS